MVFDTEKVPGYSVIRIDDLDQLSVFYKTASDEYKRGLTFETMVDTFKTITETGDIYCCRTKGMFNYCDMAWYVKSGFHVYNFTDFEWPEYSDPEMECEENVDLIWGFSD